MAKTLSQLELEFFRSHVNGANSRADIETLKKLYYISQIGAGSLKQGLSDLEKAWLRKIITDNGKTARGNYKADLIIQALSALGKPVTKFQDTNWQTLLRSL